MKKKWTAVIVEDERLARNEMRSLLAQHTEVEIVGEAATVDSALSAIDAHKPDLVFLDIKLGKESAFEVVDRLRISTRIIFVTAYDEYAVRAFEVNALDYLLKPVNPARLEETIRRVLETAPPEPAVRHLEYDDRLFLAIENRPQFIKVSELRLIRSAGDYSELLFGEGKTALMLKPLWEWERRLPSRYFARIHRSAIINLDYVEKTDEWFNHSHRVHLKGIAEPLVISRRYASRLKQTLS